MKLLAHRSASYHLTAVEIPVGRGVKPNLRHYVSLTASRLQHLHEGDVVRLRHMSPALLVVSAPPATAAPASSQATHTASAQIAPLVSAVALPAVVASAADGRTVAHLLSGCLKLSLDCGTETGEASSTYYAAVGALDRAGDGTTHGPQSPQATAVVYDLGGSAAARDALESLLAVEGRTWVVHDARAATVSLSRHGLSLGAVTLLDTQVMAGQAACLAALASPTPWEGAPVGAKVIWRQPLETALAARGLLLPPTPTGDTAARTRALFSLQRTLLGELEAAASAAVDAVAVLSLRVATTPVGAPHPLRHEVVATPVTPPVTTGSVPAGMPVSPMTPAAWASLSLPAMLGALDASDMHAALEADGFTAAELIELADDVAALMECGLKRGVAVRIKRLLAPVKAWLATGR